MYAVVLLSAMTAGAPAPIKSPPRVVSVEKELKKELPSMTVVNWGGVDWAVRFEDGLFSCYRMNWTGSGTVWCGPYKVKDNKVTIQEKEYHVDENGPPELITEEARQVIFELKRGMTGGWVGTSTGGSWGSSVPVILRWSR